MPTPDTTAPAPAGARAPRRVGLPVRAARYAGALLAEANIPAGLGLLVCIVFAATGAHRPAVTAAVAAAATVLCYTLRRLAPPRPGLADAAAMAVLGMAVAVAVNVPWLVGQIGTFLTVAVHG